MVRRAKSAVFMGGARVFPGGAIDAADRDCANVVRWSGDPEELPWRAAALRELAEEAGIVVSDPPLDVDGGADIFTAIAQAGAVLDADRLYYFSNWVTPPGLSRRFDTRFYVLEVAADAEANADLTEVFDPEWVTPAEALARGDRDEWGIEFPTRRHLEAMGRFRNCTAVVDHCRKIERVDRIEPRVVFDDDGSWSIFVPGDPGYEEALR